MGTEDLARGGGRALDLSPLEAGTYEVYCSIPGHEAAGMVGELVLGEGGDSAPSSGEGQGQGEELSGEARAEWLRANYEASVAAFPAETEAFGNQIMDRRAPARRQQAVRADDLPVRVGGRARRVRRGHRLQRHGPGSGR